ncbi:hypothetical protein ACKKBG_A27555 [Auxenochlorella protothecoides x Auxenochlorella symbiontica]|uniref:FAS1 domain-containing protein n=1 Tax=Auxenochlorella protothecoides TaxID=3075 RepID=A0A087SGP7_AUXPR|nr:Uncharacterized protein F751_1780 [Auxenochlorella protothecoides]KFM24901.1 Uncharacterized protein F751_1780 [Auxenochlorella protothecoides]
MAGRSTILMLVLAACVASSINAQYVPATEVTTTGTIVEAAQGEASLSTLVAAVVALDLAETLSGPGPFTVFAPEDSAFAEVLEILNATAAELLAEPILNETLLFHVAPGRYVVAGTVADSTKELTTVAGAPLSVRPDVADGETTIDSANLPAVFVNNPVYDISAPDAVSPNGTVAIKHITASNGEIYIIPSVLVAP